VFAGSALTPEGWRSNVRITLEGGVIASVAAGVEPEADDERHAILIPGMPNLHSHAFQRGMAGLGEVRGPGADSFWSWRETMYRFALAMQPEELQAIAAQLYVEMLEAGFTRVGEFHYLHHGPDGQRYADIAEMAVRIGAAAAASGIGLTLLPVFYAHGSFGGAAASPNQRRFLNTLDGFSSLSRRCEQIARDLPGGIAGVAPHSLRAVTPAELAVVTGMTAGPVHIHVAEQVKEVEDSLAHSGRRSVQFLYDHAPVDRRWCLIHATHIDDGELSAMARSGAVAGLCPVTEANLGDGTFRATEFVAQGGRFGIGSDSNVQIGVGDELRQLEYSQRLRDRGRNALGVPGGSTGRALFDGALAGGAQALGASGAGLAAGAPADLVSLDAHHPLLIEKRGDAILDAWIFGGAKAVDSVWRAGRKLVAGGRHIHGEAILAGYRRAMAALSGRLQG
jgi:formiminoglutamate deiminase